MKDIVQLILKYLPQYLNDLGSLLSGPNRFIVQRNSRTGEVFIESLLFFGISVVLFVIMTTALRSPGKDLWITLASQATSGLIGVFLSAICLRLA